MEKKTKKQSLKIRIILLFVVGFMILLYPTVSNQWNKYRDNKLKSEYTQAVKNLDEDILQKELEAASEYNQSLIGSSVPDAFSIREDQKDEVYENLLNVNGDGMMGYVDIPSIDVSLPIYHYTSEEVLEKGAGHLAGSSLPVGGASTHTVISAHRGLPSAKMFTDLNLLEPGDIFQIHVLDRTLTYEVDQIKEVNPDETSDLSITEGIDYATLITCTPYGVNTRRLLVRGCRTDNPSSEDGKQAVSHNTMFRNPSIIVELLCVLAGVLIAIGIVHFLGRKEGRKWGLRRGKHSKRGRRNRDE